MRPSRYRLCEIIGRPPDRVPSTAVGSTAIVASSGGRDIGRGAPRLPGRWSGAALVLSADTRRRAIPRLGTVITDVSGRCWAEPRAAGRRRAGLARLGAGRRPGGGRRGRDAAARGRRVAPCRACSRSWCSASLLWHRRTQPLADGRCSRSALSSSSTSPGAARRRRRLGGAVHDALRPGARLRAVPVGLRSRGRARVRRSSLARGGRGDRRATTPASATRLPASSCSRSPRCSAPRCASGRRRGLASSTRCGCASASSWPASCTTRWRTTSRRW